MTLVTASEWGVSYATKPPDLTVTLNVYKFHPHRPNVWGGKGYSEPHPEHNGKTFPDKAAAMAYAVEHGLLVQHDA